MNYKVVVNKAVARRIAEWPLPADLRVLLYYRLETELCDGEPNRGSYVPIPGTFTHIIRLADPNPDSDAVYTFGVILQIRDGECRIVDASYFRIGGPRAPLM